MRWIYVTEPGAKFSKCGGRYIINGKKENINQRRYQMTSYQTLNNDGPDLLKLPCGKIPPQILKYNRTR